MTYPQYCQDFEANDNLKQHFLIFKGHYVHALVLKTRDAWSNWKVDYAFKFQGSNATTF